MDFDELQSCVDEIRLCIGILRESTDKLLSTDEQEAFEELFEDVAYELYCMEEKIHIMREE